MRNQIVPIAGVALVLLILGLTLSSGPQLEVAQKGVLLEGFGKKANNLTAVRIKNAQGTLLSVGKYNESWMADALGEDKPGQYPISETELSEFLQQLVNANKVEAKTTNENKYDRLGVEAIDVEDSQSTLVELVTAEQTIAIIVGKKSKLGEGQYVRLNDQQQSWLIDQSVKLPLTSHDWLHQPIIDLEQDSIASVSHFDGQGNSSWTISKSEDEEIDYALGVMPEGRELKYTSILDSVIREVSELNFEDVFVMEGVLKQAEDTSEIRWKDLGTSAKLLVQTTEQHAVNIEIRQSDEDYFVQVSSENLQGHWNSWLYKVSQFTINQINKDLESFLAEVETETLDTDVGEAIEEGDSPQ